MPHKPLVSVIVPAYNVEPFLAETLASVQWQTYREFEVIIVDDGSTDRTSEIVQQFVEKDARFILLRQPNANMAAARNAALKQARGEWVAFLDADDAWLSEKLAAQLDLLEQAPRANLLFTDYFSWDGQNDFGDPARNAVERAADAHGFIAGDDADGNGQWLIPSA